MIKEIFEISSSNLSFESIEEEYGKISQPIQGKKIIAIPLEGYKSEGKVFHTGISEIYDFFREEDENLFEVYSDDDELREVSLHSDEFWLGSFLISSLVIPTFVNLMTSYIYDKLKAKKDDSISVSVTIDSGNGASKKVKYRGGLKNFEKAVKEINNIE